MRLLELRAPKHGTKFVAHHDRLALFHDTSEAKAYWSHYWLTEHAAKQLELAVTGILDPGFDAIIDMLDRLVPRGSTVLEGGCGLGHVVAALRARGYTATGVDYVPELVAFANGQVADLDIRVGDVEQLPFADASFDCYASLGVIEHFEHGPERAIADASRIVQPGGLAIFEVPYLNALRRKQLERLRRRASDDHHGLTFHQYYYDVDELTALFARHGFTLLEQAPNCWESVVFREHPIVARFWNSRAAVSRMRAPLRRLVQAMPAYGQLRYAHTMVYACRRVSAANGSRPRLVAR